MHNYQDLINLFKDCFFENYNTLLVKGGDEPLYTPQNDKNPHNYIFFAKGYYASALHEIAHWLIAGNERRKLEDFGYWYEPDGRSGENQMLFQSVEVKPQALEWILSKAANFRFFISNDNLDNRQEDNEVFKNAIYAQVKYYCQNGLPQRAKIFRENLSDFYKTKKELCIKDFDIESL
jgi:elongation factor P hydroxylase